MGLVRASCMRQIPAYVDGGLNIVDVRDVADGHLLADEKGEPGERYILGGRNFTLQRLFADLSRISGRRAARDAAARAAGDRRGRGDAPASACRSPSPATRPARRRSGGPTRSTKAKRELGFSARPHEETLEDAVRWQIVRARRAGRARRRSRWTSRSSSPAARCKAGRADRRRDERTRRRPLSLPDPDQLPLPVRRRRAAAAASSSSSTGPSACRTGARTAPRSSS